MTNLTIGTSAIREHDGLYSLNDLHRAAGGAAKHQPALFLRNEQTQALVAEISSTEMQISSEIQSANSRNCIEAKRGGRNRGTYACRELVIAYAAWISAEFHLKVIRVFLAAMTPVRPALPAPTPIVCTLPNHGRYLVVADGSGVRVFDAYDKSLLDAHLHRELRRDTHTLIAALAEWTKRARIVDGDASPKQLEQPLQIRFGN